MTSPLVYRFASFVGVAVLTIAAFATPAQAGVKKIVVDKKVAPAFDGR